MAEAIQPNTIYLYRDGTNYPCSFPDPTLQLPPSSRDSFVDIGDGVNPVRARVWMTSTQFLALPDGVRSGSNAVGVKMAGMSRTIDAPTDPTSFQTITFAQSFFILKASIMRYGVDAKTGTACPLYEILLVTNAQYWVNKKSDRAYNVLSDDRKSFVAGAVSSSSPTTWATMLADFATDIGVTISVTTGTPSASPFNMVVRGSALSGIRRLLRPFGLVLQADVYGAAVAYKVVQLDYTVTTTVNKLTALAAVALFEGSSEVTDIFPPLNLPQHVDVMFPKSPVATPSSASSSLDQYTTITKDSPITAASSDHAQIVAGDRWDVSSPTYSQNLDTIATERSDRYYKRVFIPQAVRIFIGGYPFLVGDNIRRVRLSMDEGETGGWFTTVWTHGLLENPREDWEACFDGIQPPYFPEHCSPVVGIACSPRDDGTTDFLGVSTAIPGAMFAVQVTKDGGSDGTQTTPASWAYTVKDVTGTTTLGTSVPQTRPRPNGEMTYQTASPSYGVAFYLADGTTLKLWDAGEVENTGASCS